MLAHFTQQCPFSDLLGFEFECWLYFILNSVEMGKSRLFGDSNAKVLDENVLETTCTHIFGHNEG